MKKTLFILALLATFSLEAQISGLVASQLLNELDASINEKINSIDNLRVDAIGDTGNMLLSISARLKKDIKETIGFTDRTLKKRQQSLFNNLMSLQDKLEQTILDGTNSFNDITLNITQAINDFIGKKTEPTVLRFNTEFFIKDYSSDNTLELTGNTFDRCENIYLKINGNNYAPIQRTHQSLVFEVPIENFKDLKSDDKYLKGEVHFAWKQGLFKKKKSRIDNFIIPVYPLVLGTVKIKFEQEKPYKKFTNIQEHNCVPCKTGGRGSGSRKKSAKSFNIVPKQGRYFDVGSISDKGTFTQRYGGNLHWTTRNEQQISGFLACQSESKLFGGGGFSHAKIFYREYEKLYEINDYETDSYEITSVNPKIIQLPDPIDGYSARVNYVEITTFDGKEVIVVPNGENRYFSLQHNMDTDEAIVSWKN